MAKRKKRAVASADSSKVRIPAEEKIARLLGLLLVKDIKQKSDQVPLLRRVGFDVADVANMLNMSEHHVVVADYNARKKKTG